MSVDMFLVTKAARLFSYMLEYFHRNNKTVSKCHCISASCFKIIVTLINESLQADQGNK